MLQKVELPEKGLQKSLFVFFPPDISVFIGLSSFGNSVINCLFHSLAVVVIKEVKPEKKSCKVSYPLSCFCVCIVFVHSTRFVESCEFPYLVLEKFSAKIHA